MEKSKRKSRQPIEFAALITLEGCIARLEERAEQEKQRSPRSNLVIQVIPADEDTCRFVFRKSGATKSVLTAQGYLQRRDANSTLVVGKTSGALTPLIIFAVVVIPLALCALMFNAGAVCCRALLSRWCSWGANGYTSGARSGN